MNWSSDERIAILGGSRGLGFAVFNALRSKLMGDQIWLLSRKSPEEECLRSDQWKNITWSKCDFSRPEDSTTFWAELQNFSPTRIWYIAGGGPHGQFAEKSWESQQWALNVNLVFPARLLHTRLSFFKKPHFGKPLQMVFVGSSIAESHSDPLAASYCSAKHGLKGLVTSVIAENPPIDLRLFSPGYMATDLLPKHAWPRQQNLAQDPNQIAIEFLSWVQDETCEKHRLLERRVDSRSSES